MSQIDNYEAAVTQSEAMVQDYYLNKPPFSNHTACIPMVPTTEDGTPMLAAADVAFKYIELSIDGEARLAILTPWPVAAGPGEKYIAVDALE